MKPSPDNLNTDNADRTEFAKFQQFKQSEASKPKFNWNATAGNVLGFSGIPGTTKADISFGKKKPIQSQQFKKKEEPTKTGDAPMPTAPKAKNATTADVEAAVRKGFITPEEAAGSSGKGATGERWYESNADGTANLSKPTKIEPMSTTYAKKLGQAQAASQANGTPLGKQFTGPASMKIETGRKAGFGEVIAPVKLD
jgi:hypothetical protein